MTRHAFVLCILLSVCASPYAAEIHCFGTAQERVLVQLVLDTSMARAISGFSCAKGDIYFEYTQESQLKRGPLAAVNIANFCATSFERLLFVGFGSPVFRSEEYSYRLQPLKYLNATGNPGGHQPDEKDCIVRTAVRHYEGMFCEIEYPLRLMPLESLIYRAHEIAVMKWATAIPAEAVLFEHEEEEGAYATADSLYYDIVISPKYGLMLIAVFDNQLQVWVYTGKWNGLPEFPDREDMSTKKGAWLTSRQEWLRTHNLECPFDEQFSIIQTEESLVAVTEAGDVFMFPLDFVTRNEDETNLQIALYEGVTAEENVVLRGEPSKMPVIRRVDNLPEVCGVLVSNESHYLVVEEAPSGMGGSALPDTIGFLPLEGCEDMDLLRLREAIVTIQERKQSLEEVD